MSNATFADVPADRTMTLDTAAPPAPVRGLRRIMLDTGYAITAFPISLIFFVLVVTGLALGVSLSILLGGVLLLPVTAYIARGNAVLERARLRSMLRRDVAEPVYLRSRPGDGFWRRALRPLRDPQSWLDMLWSLVGLVTATVAFSLVVVWWAGMLGGLSYWFWQRYIPYSSDSHGLAYYLGFGNGRTPESWVNLALGGFALLTLPLVTRLAAVTHGSLAGLLLGSRAELQQQVARVETGRDAARAAEATSLRRLERDIHDGPQQRLVRLSMELGRARKAVETDPTRAAELIDGALGQARETVAELRSLSRGVAPPLLVDRGLAVALEEMLTHSAVPVESRLDVPDGLPPHVETAVYFVVAESLTNIAKHSGATVAVVAVAPVDGDLEVRVADDGVGGADVAKGQGLAGLRQRLVAVDGTLEITSPAGGPTMLVARIPLGRDGRRR